MGMAGTAIEALTAAPGLPGEVARAAGGVLVLDAAGERLLEASGRARALAGRFADPEGRLRAGGLTAQFRALATALPATGRPRLERLRIDPDRLAPPLVCACLRTELPGTGPVLVVALPDLAARGGKLPTAAPEPTESTPEPAEPPRPSLRFLWRSDAEGRLVEVSPVLADRVRGGVVGRTWDELIGGVVTDADGRLAEALAARATFRGVPVRWRVASGPRTLAVELSATPQRANAGFQGFAGFGLVEPSQPLDAPPPDDGADRPSPTAAEPSVAPAPAQGEAPLPAFASLADAAMASLTEMLSAPFGLGWRNPTAEPVPKREPEAAPPPEPAEPPAAGTPAADGTQLSLTEHHAFREIARALGARFAGDEASEAPAEPSPGAVMPFPAVARPARARAEEESGDDARRILDRLPVGTLVHRGETALYANRAFLETVGYADVPELQADGGVAGLFLGGPSGGRRSTDAAAVGVSTKSGGTVPVEVRLTTVPWGGEPAGLMLVRRLPDIDPAQRAAALELDVAALRTRLREATAILDASGDAVVALDAGLRLTALNRRAEALFGYAEREVAGEPLALLVASEDHPALHAMQERARRGEAATGPLIGRARHGASLLLDARLTPLAVEPQAEPSGAAYCAILADASASRAAGTALAEARRGAASAGARAAAFLERAGHEIRTPLNAMLGFAEIMLEERFGPVGSERYRGYLRDLHASGTRVVGVVGDLLDLARVEAGRQAMAADPIDLNHLASGCVGLFQAQASRSRIIVRTSFAADLPRIRADSEALRQIATNLVSNAIRFTEAGGQVIVSTGETERGEVVLRVRDTGIGMTQAEIAAALDPFQATETAPNPGAPGPDPQNGTGLGLALTRALAAANGAALNLQSTRGEGTLVELLLPADRVVPRSLVAE